MKKLFTLVLALCMLLSLSACGQKLPTDGEEKEPTDQEETANVFTSPIEIVVPQKAGEISDLSARILAKYLSQEIGQSVVVSNLGGAGGSTAAHKVDDAEADGNTLLYIEEGTLTNALVGTLDMSWKDFEIVSYFGSSNSFLWATSKDSGITDVASLVNYYETNGPIPAGITAGNPSHFYAVAIEQATGVEFKAIDAGSGADKLIALLSGQLVSFPSSYAAVADYLKTNEICTAGCLGPERSPVMPDVPTFNEQGADLGEGFEKFFIIGATKGTSTEKISALEKAIQNAVSNPECIAEMEANGYTAAYKNAADAKEYLTAKETYLQPMADIINESMK